MRTPPLFLLSEILHDLLRLLSPNNGEQTKVLSERIAYSSVQIEVAGETSEEQVHEELLPENQVIVYSVSARVHGGKHHAKAQQTTR